ncbi:hypothetical protein VTO73DRAFT_4309 [Trametes versicolor]
MPALQAAAEPRPSHKPEPLGNAPFVFLFTTCTLCALFLLWRRASALRGVVAHQLTSFSRNDGRIRLSMDEGPSAREFLDDDYDEDHARLGDDEPLAVTADRLQNATKGTLHHHLRRHPHHYLQRHELFGFASRYLSIHIPVLFQGSHSPFGK